LKRAPVICFGEILWDVLPSGIFPGGAPLNVAYHLHHQGVPVQPVSSIGADALGDEIISRLSTWGVTTRGVARSRELATGTVTASVSPAGDASYVIEGPVAWDEIPVTPELCFAAAESDAIVFGSLALRSIGNRVSLETLLAALPSTAWRVFDVNLRAPFDDLSVVREFARHATLLKLNASEAARLARGGSEEADARFLADETGARVVCVTAGARGAGLLYDGNWIWEDARPVRVVESAPADALANACRIGEWVASCRGATPRYDALTPQTSGSPPLPNAPAARE
jgi:fructokinase